MKLHKRTLYWSALLILFSGCASTPAPKPEPTIDPTLPVVELTQDGIMKEMNALAFEWQSIGDKRVDGLYVYKMSAKDVTATEPTFYKTLPSRFQTHFVDNEVEPDTQYTYRFKTFSDSAEGVMSKEVVVNSLPVLGSVSWIHSIPGMPRSAKIIWRPHTNQKVKSYIIERNTLEDTEWKEYAVVEGRLSAEFLDRDLKDKYTYKYRLRVLTFDGIISSPSEIVTVVTKALPQEVTNITATRNLPKKIEVRWDKSEAKDFARYYVYRSTNTSSGYELVAKLYNNIFVDEINEDAKQYFYRVSVVDSDGLESIHDAQSIQGLTLSKPNAPAIFEARMVNAKVELSWDSVDDRTKSYRVLKRYKTSFFDETVEEFDKITKHKYTDTNLEPDMTYYYTVVAVDEFGIQSLPSIEVSLKTPAALKQKAVPSSAPKAVQTSVSTNEIVEEEIILPVANTQIQ
jgi:hypothetical protein